MCIYTNIYIYEIYMHTYIYMYKHMFASYMFIHDECARKKNSMVMSSSHTNAVHLAVCCSKN